MLLWIYRLLFPLLLVVSAPYYLLRMWRRRGYGENFANRFGCGTVLPAPKPGVRRIWLQAVSVGEMLAVGPVLEALAAGGGVELYLTTTTSTGYRLAKERYGAKVTAVEYFPLDWWPLTAKAWRRIRPDLVILAEGERWPEHLAQARRRGVPVICINARLSDRSYRRMRRMRRWVAPLWSGVTRLLAVSSFDADRFRELGFPPARLATTGNIKLDLTLTPLSDDERRQLRTELGLGTSDLIVLGSSTWPGEEDVLLDAWRAWREAGLACRLLLVPRHAERRGEIEARLQKAGVRYHLRSRGVAPGEVDVTVGDTTGELRRLTQVADVVVVGKSLPPHREGQTPVEAAALGKALVLGPELSNFRAIVAELREAGGACQVTGADEVAPVVLRLLRNPTERAALGAAAAAWHQRNQGAVARTVAVIYTELNQLQN